MDDQTCTCDDGVTVAARIATTVEGVIDRLRGHGRRREAGDHLAAYVRGLLAEVERKNGWQLAEQAGYGHPRGMQRVLDRYVWDADVVCVKKVRHRTGGLAPRPVGPAPSGPVRRACLVPGLRPGSHTAGGTCQGGRHPVDDRGGVQAGQGPGRTRSLRGPQLAGLVSSHHPCPAGLGGPRRREKGGIACVVHIARTVPELRKLLVRLVWPVQWSVEQVSAWSRWRRAHQRTAQECHRRRRLRHRLQREL